MHVCYARPQSFTGEFEVGALDGPHAPHEQFEPAGNYFGDSQPPHMKIPKFSDETIKEFGRQHDAEVKALKAPQPPERDLSLTEKNQVGEIVKRTQEYRDADLMDKPPGSVDQAIRNIHQFDQATLDLGQSISQLNCQELQKLLPSINKQLEPLGLRMASVPDNDEVVIGKLNPKSGEYEPWNFIGSPVKCPMT
jgi:hypothetical protein